MPPVRLTKERASALLEILKLGFEAERASIEETYGVKFRHDGTIDIVDVEGLLIDKSELEELTSRLGVMQLALEGEHIFHRRYA